MADSARTSVRTPRGSAKSRLPARAAGKRSSVASRSIRSTVRWLAGAVTTEQIPVRTIRHYGTNSERKLSNGTTIDVPFVHEEHRERFGRGIEVHHLVPVRLFKHWDKPPEHAHILRNLVTVCRTHHPDAPGTTVEPGDGEKIRKLKQLRR